MHRGLSLLVSFFLQVPFASAQDPGPDDPAPAVELPEFQVGLCWVGSGDAASLEDARARGANWIAASPYAYGQQVHDRPPEPGFRFSRFHVESIEGIREVVRAAHAAGLRVLLKPHIWFTVDGKWRADIAMTTEEDWAKWFGAYGAFLEPFVAMASDEGVAGFCVGTELAGTIHREREWRALIASIRERYPGSLNFAANWHDEYRKVPFWDALDQIGVQAYFPLTEDPEPGLEELVLGWKPWIEQLRETARTHERPVLFTEFGYKPRRATAIRPWEWTSDEPPDPGAQATAYRAAFEALAGEEWLAGIHLWKWYAGVPRGERPRRRAHDNFSPQGLIGAEAFFGGVRQLRPRKPTEDGGR